MPELMYQLTKVLTELLASMCMTTVGWSSADWGEGTFTSSNARESNLRSDDLLTVRIELDINLGNTHKLWTSTGITNTMHET